MNKALDKLSSVVKVLIHGVDSYSWLLAKLCSEVATTYVESSMRERLKTLAEEMSPLGKEILERYLRKNYRNRRALVWPSQVRGIEHLLAGGSFALCTPTGSGKTTVAELAILQSFFQGEASPQEPQTLSSNFNPLALYLTPSRALAAEVEVKLSQTFRDLSASSTMIVTGLYGGTDWGPTDAWLTSADKTILICTYEKAEALIRFLGPLFLHRLSLVVIDEAHNIQFEGATSLSWHAESRALRLESFGTRLLAHLESGQSKILALSAVASGTENTLARWVTGQMDARPETTAYRSTRQLIGRLECLSNRGFEIHYDLLDGSPLDFPRGGPTDTPYIPRPFPPHPPAKQWEKGGPEKRLRPYLLWAAIHLATPDNEGRQHAVLISITQYPGGYAEDFLTLLESTWAREEKPAFFSPPQESDKQQIWEACLQSCKDYFGADSREYRLLGRGIVLHHGRMPGVMGRLLIQAIQERIVYLVVATSTLSEGVNLPFETILLPSLRRGQSVLSPREFGNIVGRAGRPGVGTEGRTLVLLPRYPKIYQSALRPYRQLTSSLQRKNAGNESQESTRSPLAELLLSIERQWSQLTGLTSTDEFIEWLEQTAPLTDENSNQSYHQQLIDPLDTLDSMLLSAIVEIEELEQISLPINEWESRLKHIWQRSYARYAYQEEKRLEGFFTCRGRALVENIYPDPLQRRRLYRTSLPPRGADQLLRQYPTIRQHLEISEPYAFWSPEERFEYIRVLVEQLSTLPRFRPQAKVPSKATWEEILHWWLAPNQNGKQPTPRQVSDWYNYVSQNFGYRFNWGLGSVLAIAVNEAHGEMLKPLTLEDWSQMELPWAVFWLKELITWGTLEPVAAYLLARGGETTRSKAEAVAQTYYDEHNHNQNPNELLNAAAIREWVQKRMSQVSSVDPFSIPTEIEVELCEDFSQVPPQEWRVLPIEIGEQIYWYDPAGFPLAISKRPDGWQSHYVETHDFRLAHTKKTITSSVYV
ncbi:MAG: DEAD/DEAH box helicase [Candidatus Binatia bacterium]